MQVSDWFAEIGLEKCSNIVKYKRIDGTTIMTADEGFMTDTLGLSSVYEQQRLEFQRNKAKDGYIGKMNVYGWGANKFG